MPRLGLALGSVFFKKNQGKEQWSPYDGHVSPRDRQRSPLAPTPASPPFSHITVLNSPPVESLASDLAETPARQFGRKRFSTSLDAPTPGRAVDVHPIDTISLPSVEGAHEGAPTARRNTFSMARTFVRSGGRRWSRNAKTKHDSRWSATRSDGMLSAGRQTHSRSSSQSLEPDYEAVTRDISALKRELRRLKAVQSNELFDQAQRRQSTRRAAQKRQEAELLKVTMVPREHEESERIIASLRSELEEAMAFAQQWAQAAAKAEAELDKRRSQSEADVVTQQDFEAMGRALSEQQSELAAAKEQLEVWRQKAADASAPSPTPSQDCHADEVQEDTAEVASGEPARSPPASPIGANGEEQHDAAAPGAPAAGRGGVTATTEIFDDKQAAMIMERWQIADADNVQLEILAALLTTEDALREARTKLGNAEAECASWEERFADMEASLQTEVLRYKGIAEAAEAPLEELRSRTEERRSPSPGAQGYLASPRLRQAEEEVHRAEEARATIAQALEESEARRIDAVELASSRLHQAEEELRRAEEAREAIAQALEESEARRTDAVDQTRVLEMRFADLSARCQVHEGDASRKDEEIASLSADMGQSLASAEESLRVMEVAAEDRERELSALRSQLETAEMRAEEADEEIARLRSGADDSSVDKRDGEIMHLRFTLEEIEHLMDVNLWELRQKTLQLDAAPDWQTETSDLLDKVVGNAGERSP